MKNLLKYFVGFIGAFLCAGVAHAVCPVCTIAIGAGLEGMRMLGVKDVLTGIWAGGLTVSLIGWTANYMHKIGRASCVFCSCGKSFCKMVG